MIKNGERLPNVKKLNIWNDVDKYLSMTSLHTLCITPGLNTDIMIHVNSNSLALSHEGM